MSNPSDTLLELEASLHAVIETLIDGQKGFRKIGEELKDPTLKLYFFEESLRRAEFRGDLETILHQEGVHDIQESGTLTATVCAPGPRSRKHWAAATIPFLNPRNRTNTQRWTSTKKR